MKKKELVEVSRCDICGESGAIYDCLICGKDYCYKCHKLHTRDFKYMWWAANEKQICNACLAEPGARFSPLLLALRSMEAVHAESEAFYKKQEKRGKELEVEIDHLLKLTGDNER
jgi:hypothetical protein